MLVTLSTVVLGLMAGALLAEAAVLVPFWQGLSPQSFLTWYRTNAGYLMRFFAPLEIVAALLALLVASVTWISTGAAPLLLNASSFFSLLVLAAFPFYFKKANLSFAEATIEPDDVGAELRRWAHWHWTRVALATAAFLCAVVAARVRFPNFSPRRRHRSPLHAIALATVSTCYTDKGSISWGMHCNTALAPTETSRLHESMRMPAKARPQNRWAAGSEPSAHLKLQNEQTLLGCSAARMGR